MTLMSHSDEGLSKSPQNYFTLLSETTIRFITKHTERKQTNMLAPKANEKCYSTISQQRFSQLCGPLCQLPSTCGHYIQVKH